MSLKDIRVRINSVKTTLKITDVTRMISSAKLHKAQNTLRYFFEYQSRIRNILFSTLSYEIPLMEQRRQENVVIVALSSNGSLCGAFNLNVIKHTNELINKYKKQGVTNIILYAVGKKVYDSFANNKTITVKGPFHNIIEIHNYNTFSPLMDELTKSFLDKQIDSVDFVYNRFKNILTQYVVAEKVLPLENPNNEEQPTDYIVEPGKKELVESLAPETVRLTMYEKLLESVAAEYGARSSAMQAASDNAQDLISALALQYNKVRQAAITKEILDIVGGAEALRG